MISIDDLLNLYPAKSINVTGRLNFNEVDHSVKPRVDQEALKRAALHPHQWHESLLRLTASLVNEGKTDDEIHETTTRLTCPPHTVEETRIEVQKMIDGARAKGYGSKSKNKHGHQLSNSSEPLPLLRKSPAPEQYPINALGDLKGIVEAVHKFTQAPIEIAAASALSATALIVQGHANVETLGGVKPLSLYMLTVARSGERKSSCDAPIIAAIKDFEKTTAKDMEYVFHISNA